MALCVTAGTNNYASSKGTTGKEGLVYAGDRPPAHIISNSAAITINRLAVELRRRSLFEPRTMQAPMARFLRSLQEQTVCRTSHGTVWGRIFAACPVCFACSLRRCTPPTVPYVKLGA